ncbi:hypothetical protein AB0L05_25135 [Nonomuraea pusilla]|uniref:hypothetical protein n=1 Tax=Nonomuraea pusilla TaxID=46177 RepID=UPI0033288DEC
MRSGRERRAAGVVPWLLLAVLLTLGVAAMHTLGHLGAPMAHPANPADPGMTQVSAAHHGSGTPRDGGHDSAFTCLTILAAAVVLALPLSALPIPGWTSPSRPGAARRRRPAPQRGPPLSLVLTRTVVLRT